jgi:hypothetical protein
MDDHEGAIPVRDAAKSLGLLSTTERLQGMQVPLMPHQLIGVAWMVKQELGMVGGGILACVVFLLPWNGDIDGLDDGDSDDMGLGCVRLSKSN